MEQQFHELTLADNSITIFIHTLKNIFNVLTTLKLILQELNNFLEGYLPTVVDIKIRESLLEMFLANFCFEIDSGY